MIVIIHPVHSLKQPCCIVKRFIITILCKSRLNIALIFSRDFTLIQIIVSTNHYTTGCVYKQHNQVVSNPVFIQISVVYNTTRKKNNRECNSVVFQNPYFVGKREKNTTYCFVLFHFL